MYTVPNVDTHDGVSGYDVVGCSRLTIPTTTGKLRRGRGGIVAGLRNTESSPMYVLAYSRCSPPAGEASLKATRDMVATEDTMDRAHATNTKVHRSRSNTIFLPRVTIAYRSHIVSIGDHW